MRRNRIPQAINHMDLAVLYGIKPARHRWDEERLENFACILGGVAFWIGMTVLVGAWFAGVI